MERTRLGRSGLDVSVAGLGCGGPSRLGMATGVSEAGSIEVVRTAIELGINLIDTAEVYGTEEIVGKAIRGRRDEVVLCTKGWWGGRDGGVRSPSAIEHAFEASLERLQTDHVDVYFLHGVTPEAYPEVADTLVPVIQRLRDQGKTKAIGVTEQFGEDQGHSMLRDALTDDWADVVMVGFNLLNQSARDRVFALTKERDVGTLDMFAVRRALSVPENLRATISSLAADGLLDEELDDDDPLGFLVHEGGATSVVDASYRFCRDEPGIDVVLTGTGNAHHLRENVASLERPALPDEVTERLRRIFARVDSVSGN